MAFGTSTEKKRPFHYWKLRMVLCIILLLLSFLGVLITEMKQDGALSYWRFLSIFYAVISIGLSVFLRKKEERHVVATIWHELLHWSALFFAVFIISSMVHVGLLGRFVASLVVLLILALSTFLAGVYIEVSFVFIGIVLGLFSLGLSLFSAYLYPIVIPLALLCVLALWFHLRRSHEIHGTNTDSHRS